MKKIIAVAMLLAGGLYGQTLTPSFSALMVTGTTAMSTLTIAYTGAQASSLSWNMNLPLGTTYGWNTGTGAVDGQLTCGPKSSVIVCTLTGGVSGINAGPVAVLLLHFPVAKVGQVFQFSFGELTVTTKTSMFVGITAGS